MDRRDRRDRRRLVVCGLFSLFGVVTSRTPHPAAARPFPRPLAMAAAARAPSATPGALLVSNLYRIGAATDASSSDLLQLRLASQSPRRREILDMMGLAGRYTAAPSPLNEEALQAELAQQDISPRDYACTLAERKAHAALGSSTACGEGTTLVVGSDTIVDLDGRIMEKPKNEGDAFDMLQRLSGKWHKVHTGVAVYATGTSERTKEKLMFSFTDTANVKFAPLTEADIRAYVATKEPLDKAGAYGIQGIGGQLVERLDGDFFTVMGLPMHRFSRELSAAIESLST